ncbi:MgtC/SapB family protein [Alkalibacterium sp. f15]|uniref:MgtC/SapB family protein n=1 Tax=Alkalibacterium sp. f15 TaxID=3414029 RepID=UPI003BF81D58
MKHHAAGFRTYILVCLGSTMVMMTNQFISDMYNTGDPARMGAQVISGIGFLGAGTILVTSNNHVKGLTTAAGLWSAACIGLAIGIGFYQGAIIGAFSLLVIISSFQKIKRLLINKKNSVDFYILFETLEDFHDFLTYCAIKKWKIIAIQEEFSQKDKYVMNFVSLKFTNREEANNLLKNFENIKGFLSVDKL